MCATGGLPTSATSRTDVVSSEGLNSIVSTDNLGSMNETPYRKRVQHFNVPGHAHLLTFSCYQRMSLLIRDDWRAWFSGGIDRTFQKQEWGLIAFVYMPEHVHLLAAPFRDDYKVDNSQQPRASR